MRLSRQRDTFNAGNYFDQKGVNVIWNDFIGLVTLLLNGYLIANRHTLSIVFLNKYCIYTC